MHLFHDSDDFFDRTFSHEDCRAEVVADKVIFEGGKMIGINWTDVSAFHHVSFKRCNLNYGNFSGQGLKKLTLIDCVARDVDFSESNLTEANLQRTDFSGSQFRETNLTKSDLRGAQNYGINPLNNKLRQARFSLPEAMLLLRGLEIILE